MTINPFRIGELNIPANPRPVPLDFSPLADAGASIGRYREQQDRGSILAAAVDPTTGNLDIQKAATGLASGGYVREARELLATELQRQGLAQAGTAQAETARAHRAQEEIARIAAERPQYFPQQPDPIFGGGGVLEAPRKPGAAPIWHPWPNAPGAAVPGPQSSAEDQLPPAARFAAAGSAMGEQLPANFYPPPGGQPTPSEGPPYQVAQAAPAPATAPETAAGRNEAWLRTLPPAGQALIKGLADYQIDPAKASDRQLAAVKFYRPDYNMSEYQKRTSPPSGEIAARIGLARAFFDKLDDRTDAQGNVIPGIKSRLNAGELTGNVSNRLQAVLGQNAPGDLRAAIDEGAEGLLRMLTGAGMSNTEAGNYVRRYQFGPIDNLQTMQNKLGGLENALRYTATEVGKGRGGDDFLKGFQSQFGKPVAGAAAAAPVRVSSPDEARKLPRGTQIILPDGSVGRVP